MSTIEAGIDQLLTLRAFNTRLLPAGFTKPAWFAQSLAYWERKGRLRPIRRGVYVTVPPGETPKAVNPLVVATVLTEPYAVSLHSSLAIRGIAEAVGNQIYIQSPRRFAPLSYEGTKFVWVKAPSLFGVESIHIDGLDVQVTDTERTILDCLRFPNYAGGIDELLRSLEGVQRHDLLTEILEADLAGTPARWKALRAKFDDRRAELDALVQAGLIRLQDDQTQLTLLGLAYCPDPRAEAVVEAVRKVFGLLRAHYKANLESPLQIADVEHGTGLARSLIKLAVTALWATGIPIGLSGDGNAMTAHEPILDFRDLDQLLARRLADHQPPKELSLRKKGLPYVRFDRLLTYLKEFGEKSLYAKAGLLASLMAATWKPPADFLRETQRHVGAHKTYFPAGLPKGTGRLVSEWNLIVPRSVYSRYVRSQNPSAEKDADALV